MIFNISFAYVVCRISYFLPAQSVMTACVLYFSIVTGLTLYLSNCEKKVNLKSASIVALSSVLVGGILMMIFYEITFVKFFLCSIGASFVAAYLIYYTYLLYEERRQSIKLDDQVMGIISFYTDVFSVVKHLFDGD